MPATYSIDPRQRLVVSVLSGALTDDEVREHNRTLRVDPEFDPEYRQLIDLSGLTEILVDATTINEAAQDQYFTPGTRRAFIATSEAAYGFARMFALKAEGSGQTVEVFRDRGEAEAWLAVEKG